MTPRAAAKAAGETYYFTGKECPHGHVAKRVTSSGVCTECLATSRREYMRRQREEQPEKVAAQKAAHYQRRKEHIKERVNANYRADPETHRRRAREYAAEHQVEARNRAKVWSAENKDRKSASDKQWRAENRGRNNALKARYRAARLSATPPWLSKEQRDAMVEFYKAAKQLSDSTGIAHEVDHIVPLQGKTVCGLHVPWNLRVIPQQDNNRRPRIWADKE